MVDDVPVSGGLTDLRDQIAHDIHASDGNAMFSFEDSGPWYRATADAIVTERVAPLLAAKDQESAAAKAEAREAVARAIETAAAFATKTADGLTVKALRGKLAEAFAALDRDQWGGDNGFCVYGGDDESDSFVDCAAEVAQAHYLSLLANVQEGLDAAKRERYEARAEVERLRAELAAAQERAKFFARAYDDSVRELNAFADRHEQCDVTAEEAEQDDAACTAPDRKPRRDERINPAGLYTEPTDPAGA